MNKKQTAKKKKKKKEETNLGKLLINLRNDLNQNFKRTWVFEQGGKSVDSILPIK